MLSEKMFPDDENDEKIFMKEQFYKTTYFGLIFMIIYPIGTVIYRQLAWNLACSSWRQFRNFWFDKKFHFVLQAQKTGDFWCHWLSVTVSKRASLSALHNWRLENKWLCKKCNLDCFGVFHAKFHIYSSKNVGVMGSNSWGKKFKNEHFEKIAIESCAYNTITQEHGSLTCDNFG